MALETILEQIILFNLISLWAGILAVYFWVNIYYRAKKGSMAWLLFALTAVFMISASLFPYLILYFSNIPLEEKYILSLNFLIFWGMVYTGFFASAGYALKKDLVKAPEKVLGKFLIDGFYIPEKPNETKDVQERIPSLEAGRVSKLFKGKTYVEYSPEDRREDAVVELCFRYWGDLRNTLLITSPPRDAYYREKLSDLLETGAIKIVSLSGREEMIESDGYIQLPVNQLERVSLFFEGLPEGCSILFDIHSRFNKTQNDEPKVVKELLSKVADRDVIYFSRKPENIEKLFDKKAIVRKERLIIENGDKETLVMAMGKKFFMNAENE